MYKITSEIPETGQFIVIWKYNGLIWCDTVIRVESKGLMCYDNNTDDFTLPFMLPSETEATCSYVVLEEEKDAN